MRRAGGGLIALLGLLALLSYTGAVAPGGVDASADSDVTPTAGLSQDFGRLPLYFIENRGQVDARATHYLHGRDTSVYFTSSGLRLVIHADADGGASLGSAGRLEHMSGHHASFLAQPAAIATGGGGTASRAVLALDFVDADPDVRPVGKDPAAAVVSYLTGAPESWRTGLRTYSSLIYRELWPGIDLVYSGSGDRLKYTFLVKPGADPGRIRLAYRGASSVGLTPDGQLRVLTPTGAFTDERPTAYQETHGTQTPVHAEYNLADVGNDQPQRAAAARHEYGFQLGDYDRSKPLVLDPALIVYAGFLGGAGDDRGLGIAVDDSGQAYVAGQTTSTQDTFPETVGPDLTANGGLDGFVAKLNAAGTEILYASFIGGANDDAVFDVEVDGTGSAYLTGFTGSPQTSFPVVGGPDTTFNGGVDAFVAKVDTTGTSLLYSGYLGGRAVDFAEGVAVDASGNAYLTGITEADQLTFPATVGPDLTYNGGRFDAFVAKVDSSGSNLVYAGYIGGGGNDAPLFPGRDFVISGGHIAVDAAGNAYVSGATNSNEFTFPDGDGFGTLPGPDRTHNGFEDAFVAKVRADGTGLVYAGYIGGAGKDFGFGMAVDQAGNAYLTGHTDSTQSTFPVTVGPDRTYNGGVDAFAAKVRADGTGLIYCGYLGGPDVDQGLGVALHENSHGAFLHVVGHTHSGDGFPVVSGPDPTFNGASGNGDAFLTAVRPMPDQADVRRNLLLSGYIGGAGEDGALWVDVDGDGNAYVVGDTDSTEATFPDGDGLGALQSADTTANGGVDAFVTKVQPPPPPVNDDFADAMTIQILPFSHGLTTHAASSEPNEPSPCGAVAATVWYRFTPTSAAHVQVDTYGSSYDTVLAAYTGTSLTDLSLVACNDDSGGTLQSQLSLGLTADTTYFIQAGGFQGQTGDLVLTVAEVLPLTNDDFADATVIEALPFTDSVTTTSATTESGEPQPCGRIASTVWYRFTPTTDVSVQADTFGSSYDTVLAAYTGTSLTDLTLVACNDDSAETLQSQLSLSLTAGTTYVLQAGGYDGRTGNLVLNVE